MRARTSESPWLLAVCLAVILIWYPSLTLLLGFAPTQPLDFGLAFNSMAEHLLAGRFDVDPDAIGAEGYESGGRTVAYFGVFCALLRIPLVLPPGFVKTDVTWWSCLAAMCLSAWFQCRAVLLVWRPGTGMWGRRDLLAAGLLVSVLFGGQHVQFLRPSIFQETVDWGSAEAMAFVFLAARGVTTARGFDRTTLCLMALCAGLGLITRVSFGVGLYAALGCLLVASCWPFMMANLKRGLRSDRHGPDTPGHDGRPWLAPACVLLTFIAIAALVNIGRWGNPLVFADLSHYDLALDVDPGRLGRLAAYGTFNPARIFLTLGYYFVPVWIWVRTDGHVLFAEAQAAMMDSMELPAGSFFVTDLLLLGLAVAGLRAVRDRMRAALLLGLAIEPILILCAISTAHRYRMEFYPVLFMAALFGLLMPAWNAKATPRFRACVMAFTLLGVLASHAMAVIAARSPLGTGDFYLERYGLIGTYTR